MVVQNNNSSILDTYWGENQSFVREGFLPRERDGTGRKSRSCPVQKLAKGNIPVIPLPVLYIFSFPVNFGSTRKVFPYVYVLSRKNSP